METETPTPPQPSIKRSWSLRFDAHGNGDPEQLDEAVVLLLIGVELPPCIVWNPPDINTMPAP